MVKKFCTWTDFDDFSEEFDGQGHRLKVIQLKNLILEFLLAFPNLYDISAYKGFRCVFMRRISRMRRHILHVPMCEITKYACEHK